MEINEALVSLQNLIETKHPVYWPAWQTLKAAVLEKQTTNSAIMPCERHSCCNCGNSMCPMNGVNCSEFIERTA